MHYLDRNEFNFGPAPKVVEAVKSFNAERLCFYTRSYEEGVKSCLSVKLSEIYGVAENQVLLGYGEEDILKNVVHYHLTTGVGNRIMIPEFSWWYYSRLASECSGDTLTYPLHEIGDVFRYDVDELVEQARRYRPRLLLIASPNNPTGYGLTSDELRRLMIGIPAETVVLVDEAYASFVTTDTGYIAPLVNEFDNLIFARSFSKFYGLPGLRMGFAIVGKNHRAFLDYSNKYLGYSRFNEEVALAALESEDYYRGVAERMQEARELFKCELGSLAGFKVYESVANFVLIKYPADLKDAFQSALERAEYKVKFLSDKGLENCVRVTLGRPEQVRFVCDTFVSEYKKARGLS